MRILTVLGVLLCFPARSSAKEDTVWVPSYNYDERIDKEKGLIIRKPTILVLHYTVASLRNTLKIFQTNGTRSSHFTVAKNGTIYQHVKEKYRAWHAGVGKWRDVNDVNTYSIGIEIENAGFKAKPSQPRGKVVPGSSLEWYPFRLKQIQAVINLSSHIVKRYKIEPRNVIGHADLAPGRKQDPGPLFPWKELWEKGIGAWGNYQESNNSGNETTVLSVQTKLRKYGYTTASTSGYLDKKTKEVLVSFQMHFRHSNISGSIDEKTVSVLDTLLKKYVHH